MHQTLEQRRHNRRGISHGLVCPLHLRRLMAGSLSTSTTGPCPQRTLGSMATRPVFPARKMGRRSASSGLVLSPQAPTGPCPQRTLKSTATRTQTQSRHTPSSARKGKRPPVGQTAPPEPPRGVRHKEPSAREAASHRERSERGTNTKEPSAAEGASHGRRSRPETNNKAIPPRDCCQSRPASPVCFHKKQKGQHS